MTFREILAKVIDQTPGALAGAIMAGDGIPVDEYAPSEQVDLASLSVEFQGLFEQTRKVAGSLYENSTEPLQEMILVTSGHQILFRPVDGEFFLVIVLSPDGLLGKARYLVRALLQDLKETL